MRDLLPLMKILRDALQMEVEACNYYRAASRSSPFEETRALLMQLSGQNF